MEDSLKDKLNDVQLLRESRLWKQLLQRKGIHLEAGYMLANPNNTGQLGVLRIF